MSAQNQTLANEKAPGPGRPFGWLRRQLNALYFGEGRAARRFQYGLLGFDILVVAFFIASSFGEKLGWLVILDYVLAALMLAELVARLLAMRRPVRHVFGFATIFDLLVIGSLCAPAFVSNFAFLRVARMLRLLRSYQVLQRMRSHSLWFRKHEDLIQSALNLFIFVFVVAAVVFVVEGRRNPSINNYFDALYFTVTTLTTTGFGDITMTDTAGRILAVLIMVCGVTLFLRLVQVIFRPPKVHVVCPRCGLSRHEPDAVHCKHCGEIINIPTQGEWT